MTTAPPIPLAELTLEHIRRATGMGRSLMHHNCHATSLALVRSGLLGPAGPGNARVARGTCRGVGGQHSWVVLGDPYHGDAPIIDATLWSYRDDVSDAWTGTMDEGLHVPHGWGSIWSYGKPAHGGGPDIELAVPLPKGGAAGFMDMMLPLDRRGWSALANAPVLGWPAGDVFAAMADTPELSSLVPIDVLGMVTDRNPSGLYW